MWRLSGTSGQREVSYTCRWVPTYSAFSGWLKRFSTISGVWSPKTYSTHEPLTHVLSAHVRHHTTFYFIHIGFLNHRSSSSTCCRYNIRLTDSPLTTSALTLIRHKQPQTSAFRFSPKSHRNRPFQIPSNSLSLLQLANTKHGKRHSPFAFAFAVGILRTAWSGSSMSSSQRKYHYSPRPDPRLCAVFGQNF